VTDDDRVALSSIRFGATGAGPDAQALLTRDGTPLGMPPPPQSLKSGPSQLQQQQAEKQNWMETSMEAAFENAALPPWALRAGARETIYHDPAHVTAAIVTCGGLCPGLNDVIAGLVSRLEDYGVPEGNILGIKYGFRGFYDKNNRPVALTKKSVDTIHLQGGTILGTSRGGANIKEIVKRLDMWGVDMLFVVGGNGGNAGANAIYQKCEEAGVVCNVIGVPKSIDNDILLIDRCFGFDTAVEEAQRALMAARTEAASARHGIGIVKLMGRQSGFIAVQASLASGVVDACLIPEVPFRLSGPKGLFGHIRRVLDAKGYCVVCVAEGAGQELLDEANSSAGGANGGPRGGTDASGNPILQDVGVFLRDACKREFRDADVKYIDPSYIIRSIPTSSNDRIYCKILAHNAVHGAFAGFTGVTVGLVNTHYCYLPIPVIIQAPRRIDPRGRMWNRLRAAIGQLDF
jgi:6-phosphofructokinase 1